MIRTRQSGVFLFSFRVLKAGALCASALLLAACAMPAGSRGGANGASVTSFPLPRVSAADDATRLQWLDRVAWGANARSAEQLARNGLPAWLRAQLHPDAAGLPPAAQAQIDAMTLTRTPFDPLAVSLEAQRAAAQALTDDDQKKAAQRDYQTRLNALLREARQRAVLRALYSPHQLQEQMTWFWMNHFNVDARKDNLRALVGDYEETAIRPHALGRFRDLLGATARHPAMLRYLDNAQNAANRINENYARELMELHTLGVGSGYTQGDVQELARVLTGVGVTLRGPAAPPPRLRPELQDAYVLRGLFEFNPARHDFGPKTLLGRPMTQRGLAEVDEALDRLARAPATARFISRKLAVYFVADAPPPALVERMAATFTRSDGDIAAVLTTMFESPDFSASLGRKFSDPVHYVIGSVRLAYDDRVVTDVGPMLGWLDRMGEPLYTHATPDGYSLTQDAWASAGQMATRFEIARAMGANGGVLFRTADASVVAVAPAPPALAASAAVRTAMPGWSVDTREALAQAATVQDWNTFLLASPEHMHR